MATRVKMLKEDILNGVPQDCKCCAVAQTLRRQFDTNDVEVTTHYIWCAGQEYECPDEVVDLIIAFDEFEDNEDVRKNCSLEPIEFDLVVAEEEYEDVEEYEDEDEE